MVVDAIAQISHKMDVTKVFSRVDFEKTEVEGFVHAGRKTDGLRKSLGSSQALVAVL